MDKSIDLFGNKVVFLKPTLNKKKELFNDYEGFVNKFKPKKTTDDCYTPPEVYNCVLNYVVKKCKIKDANIVRPFYPGGDYEKCEYPDGCVVIDNPPFSIISKIAKFYLERGIKFFLFAPHLTLFSARADYTRIVVGAPIIYENGANVKTSFISNMFNDILVMSDPILYQDLENIKKSRKKKDLPLYKYPPEVLTVSDVQWCVERGISMSFKKSELNQISGLDSQKKYKKAIYGAGYLLSKEATAAKEAAKEAEEREKRAIRWELSDKEKNIIKSLGR